jgi:GNAT superfamily N-acetyltransferase
VNDDTSWIVGLMRANYDAIGFIPETTVAEQYIRQERYILQLDERGNRVGFLLHGAVHSGGLLTVAQHCIDDDHRLHGYGEQAFETLLSRARQGGCHGIKLRCASELPSNEFWQRMGLIHTATQHPVTVRHRTINIYLLDLWPTLFALEQQPAMPTRDEREEGGERS